MKYVFVRSSYVKVLLDFTFNSEELNSVLLDVMMTDVTGMQVKPCNGKQPIVDPLTQLELDCGSGPHRRDCPLNTYCHHTSKFARCCPKGEILINTICTVRKRK